MTRTAVGKWTSCSNLHSVSGVCVCMRVTPHGRAENKLLVWLAKLKF